MLCRNVNFVLSAGFCIELIDRLAQLLKFNYTFIVQPDGVYGVLNKTTNEWNGMMRRLMNEVHT